METINVALIGYGSGGRIFNAPIISAVEGYKISTVLTSSPENVKLAEVSLPNAVVTDNYESILKDPKIELVIITTPNHLHKEFAEKALLAGKHVVVEKPFTSTVEEAKELIEIAKANKKVLSVNQNRRWDSDIRTIKRVIDEGKLGKIVEYEAHFDRFRPALKDSWKEKQRYPGSGLLYDLGSHLIDQALWLFGNPYEVFAHLRIQRNDSEVIDNFEILMLYPALKVTLKAGMFVKEPGPRYQVFGTKGSFVKSGMDVQEEALKQGFKPNENPDWGKEPQEIWGKLSTLDSSELIPSETGDYRKLYENIYNAIRKSAPLEVSPVQASAVIRIIELALQSHSEKRILPFNE